MTKYVMQYPDGQWVVRDDSTGPMSTGGYPFPTTDVSKATTWDTMQKALKYRAVGKNNWTVHVLTYHTENMHLSEEDIARELGDAEYLEYLRLKKIYGGS